ncbi:DNA polymerase I [Christensenella tenuis]|uniref:DNA polymerase I n=1 Tax=Christensenella tenuis TaxID=2763033 RepID=A0ABR7EAR2_9FIRM|nr:DNA polymerase I [Christensenella tenuis]MBC5646859.1 DNA polymerase I [Christensenella tenuis]
MADTLLAIDGNSLVFRAYWALPTTMQDKEGRPTNAMYGFFTMLFRVVEEYHPTYIAVAFDRSEKTFRHKKYEEYKAGRRKTPDELLAQIPMLQDALQRIGVQWVDQAGYEADDIIGALSVQAEGKNMSSYIFTADKDQLQLIDGHISVVLTKKGVTETKLMTGETLMEEMGLTPAQIPDLKALMGDASDNIPGIAGIGEKTALKLLHEYPTIEALYENIDNLPKNKLHEKLVSGKEAAFMSKDLATIETDMPLKKTLEDFKFQGFDMDGLRSVSEQYRFTSFLKRFNLGQEKEKTIKTEIISPQELGILDDAYEFALLIKDGVRIAISGETEYVIPLKQTLLDEGYDLNDVLRELKPFLADKKIIAHDVKALMHEWGNLFRDFYDTMLGAWVLSPSYPKYDLASVMKRAELEENAADLFTLAERQRDEIERTELENIMYEIEEPLLRVLYGMEAEGFRVSRDALARLGEKYDKEIGALTEKIFELAGESFNISSTKQLAEILFEKLGLPIVKKTKTGYSTDIEVLEKLEKKHPIIPYIVEYRALTKLKGTYIDGLIGMIRGGVIHTTFLQTATATGRLSSAEPNLQNIPIKSAMANDIRSAFVAPDGYQIVSADYSQIELRILAAIADDRHLKDAFMKGQDIHARTAAEVLGKAIEEVTPAERASAKAVNFGIVYGISDFGLARNLGISRKQAAEYIARYFEEFSGVRKYMDKIIAQAHEDGFVRTLCGRIRYIPELSSGNYNIRSFGERAALNTPIQGSAADIIKIAMNRVKQALAEHSYESKLVLQVHDELILYAKDGEVETVTELLRDCMENAMKLSVPLRVNVAQGKTWAEAK